MQRHRNQVLKVPEIAVWLDKYSRQPSAKYGGPPTVLGHRARSRLVDIISFLKTQTPINIELYQVAEKGSIWAGTLSPAGLYSVGVVAGPLGEGQAASNRGSRARL